MTRRIVRTISQLGAVTVVTFLVILFLDRNYRVLPNVVHEYMPQHHHGLVVTDLTLTSCSSANPFSTCDLDKAVWHRVEKDLYLGKTWFAKAYLHVQRKKEEELTSEDSVVVDVAVGRLDPSSTNSGKDKSEAGQKWESRPGGIWILRSEKRHASDSDKAVTAVDALFGDDAVEARDGWHIQGTPLLLDSKTESVHLTVRRGVPGSPAKPQPKVRDNGRFKIMQLADIHLSTGVGHCRDAVPNEYAGGPCLADPRTLDFMSLMLEEEKPDLVVLSGDQVNGDTAPDAQTPIFKYANLLIKHKIPYVCIFGNHDDEGLAVSRAAQMSLIETLPYSLSVSGPDNIDGVGNYYVEVLAQGASKHSAITIYLLDSHSYSPDERHFPGYNWIKQSQIDWFRDTAQGLKKKHKEYTKIHLDVAFIHIPLPEYGEPTNPKFGEWREGVTAPTYNSGFRDALVEQGVVMVGCGHDHANEYCMLSSSAPPAAEGKDDEQKKKQEQERPAHPELWMCYAGGAGFGGYGGYGGYVRRARFYDFDMNVARVTTYKRLEYAEDPADLSKRVDEQVIVDGGIVQPAPVVEEEVEGEGEENGGKEGAKKKEGEKGKGKKQKGEKREEGEGRARPVGRYVKLHLTNWPLMTSMRAPEKCLPII
ncbi:Metallo-dependent phosphatase-like protein [Microdochium bolleyi]|uniref:Metallo-dependent phosphatase-like protein n=1 Tax=Microdochium bolleyi TaxID=196109 RepID=A0A136J6K4_9PEZI|nr:Metallo-dependent phosphatase-like protein [Microdochium bolleyi]